MLPVPRLVKGWEGRYFEDFQVGDIFPVAEPAER
jgi:hypothetical protein